MSLLDKLKAVLGAGSNRDSGSSNATSGAAGTRSNASTSSERAVKEPADPTPDSGSTSEPTVEDTSAGEEDTYSVETTEDTPDTPDPITDAESESADEAADDGTPVSEISGIGPAYSDRLASIGIETVGDLAAAEPDGIAGETDISIGRVSNWIERARDF